MQHQEQWRNARTGVKLDVPINCSLFFFSMVKLYIDLGVSKCIVIWRVYIYNIRGKKLRKCLSMRRKKKYIYIYIDLNSCQVCDSLILVGAQFWESLEFILYCKCGPMCKWHLKLSNKLKTSNMDIFKVIGRQGHVLC